MPGSGLPSPPVVGLTASSGGVAALTRFFDALPASTGMAFVVVMAGTGASADGLRQLLAAHTRLAVTEAVDGQRLDADRVYVVRPDHRLLVSHGLLRLTPADGPDGRRGTIDRFLRSLADDQGERAAGVVLSGTGADGTIGLLAIKGAGGLILAQAPETASHPDMPGSAIATGSVDLVLPPEAMPAVLGTYYGHPARSQRRVEADDGGEAASGLDDVIARVTRHSHLDFAAYKPGTVQRRTARRMRVRRLHSVADYVRYLDAHPEEVEQLARDLLIGVTAFFRDAPAFEELATTVIAPLVRRATADPIRIWVAGCATGEEAYSIAMLVAEEAVLARTRPDVRIFATDADSRALEVARAGVYPEAIALDVARSRLDRFFARAGEGYRVAPAIRDAVMFTRHDLLADPPFAGLDLVSCRNVLIYLRPEAQGRLLTTFHGSLNPGGHLFLGSSETAAAGGDLFATVSAGSRIYARRPVVRRSTIPSPPKGWRPSGAALPAPVAAGPTIATLASLQLLARAGTVALVVDGKGRVVHSFGRVGRYFDLPASGPVLDVNAMVRPPLTSAFAAALRRAARSGRTVVVQRRSHRREEPGPPVRLTIAPLLGARDAGAMLVIAEDAPAAPRRHHAKV